MFLFSPFFFPSQVVRFFFSPPLVAKMPATAPNHRQCLGTRSKTRRAGRPIGRLEPTIQDVLQAGEEDQQLLRRELN